MEPPDGPACFRHSWSHLSEDQPDVDHLYVGGLWKASCHADEQGGQDQQRGQVHRHCRLKEEVFEEVGGVDDDEHKYGGQVDCQDGVQDPPLQRKHLFE